MNKGLSIITDLRLQYFDIWILIFFNAFLKTYFFTYIEGTEAHFNVELLIFCHDLIFWQAQLQFYSRVHNAHSMRMQERKCD